MATSNVDVDIDNVKVRVAETNFDCGRKGWSTH